MANPLTFKPHPVDRRRELERRLSAAPRQHAEALLVVYDIIQSAHENGTLDAVHGLVTARDKIFGRISELAKTPESETALLNLLQFAKILSSIDPDILGCISQAVSESTQQHQQRTPPPSLWQIFRRATSEDGRRGFSFLTLMLVKLGRSQKR
jgi:uncharacterized protein YjgD (DUF1641 family)